MFEVVKTQPDGDTEQRWDNMLVPLERDCVMIVGIDRLW
jgi:hypothetical protein